MKPPSVRARRWFLTLFSVVALAVATACGEHIATLTTLQRNTGHASGLILAADGNFYGTTHPVDRSNAGAVFRMTPAGIITTVYAFTGGGDGRNPAGPLVQATDGNFYGVTSSGGANGYGTAFKLSPTGELTTLHNFEFGNTGYPLNGLTLGTDGILYGTTYGAGLPYGSGVAYRLTPAGEFSVLYAVGGTPARLTQGGDGNLYGTTYFSVFGYGGVVYRLTPGGGYTSLYDFAQQYQDTTYGVLFSMAGLTLGTDGNLYGTTYNGGPPGIDYFAFTPGAGTMFRVAPDGVLTILHYFNGGIEGGAIEAELVQGADGNFYGAASQGGAQNNGTLFETTSAGTVNTLYAFSGDDGTGPATTLTPAGRGLFYGTTSPDPLTGRDGTIFKLMLGTAPSPFFAGALPQGHNTYFLRFADGNYFGYYAFLSDPHYLYHFDLGFEYVFDAADGEGGVYLYDFKSNTFFYTSPTLPFPYLYDFSLNAFLYYFPDPNHSGHYNTDGTRYFYNFATGRTITK